jgi:hypothetical protein
MGVLLSRRAAISAGVWSKVPAPTVMATVDPVGKSWQIPRWLDTACVYAQQIQSWLPV